MAAMNALKSQRLTTLPRGITRKEVNHTAMRICANKKRQRKSAERQIGIKVKKRFG